ncbi:MAG TPA: DUF488 family protein [Pinirhizobacter sp.]|uniref:DUF488 domain-containing protein n=1 Tax=Pinirhizobacter sp. TaxID=2950432 RepID=UPI002C14505D|nr:DUF488 family protein [Pinirhizobacter sp.]HMH69625.1 DUF488 family protein [Pinirhizobacter sp.]
MPVFATKRIHETPEPSDGHRVLVDRLWPRGVSKVRAALDDWKKDLAPSVELRQWFDHDPARFKEFSAHYLDELRANPAVDAFLADVNGRHTMLLYAAKDPEINHALVLLRYLNRRLPKKVAR